MSTTQRTWELGSKVRRRVRETLDRTPPVVPVLTALYANLDGKSTVELLAIMRHESHRIEKAVYNDILDSKRSDYVRKRDRVVEIHVLLEQRGVRHDEPTWVWSRQIVDAFDALETDFIRARSTPSPSLDLAKIEPFLEFLQSRRSVRVWSDEQPDAAVLRRTAEQMITAAKSAPTSGDRQPWRFRIIDDPDEKALLHGIKEEHCTSAPVLVFVGMDRRVYGALGDGEAGLYIDAGAAIMQMYLLAHAAGLGMCWNHFARDLVDSRPKNQVTYARFAEALAIPDHVEPVAIVAFGAGRYVPPAPARTDNADLHLGELPC